MPAEKKTANDIVPMYAPDGTARLVPVDEMHALMMRGARPGLLMMPPGGKEPMVVRFEDGEAALKSGGTLLQNNGDPYPEGEAPVVVGHNAAGEPIWGSKTGAQALNEPLPDARGRALRAAMNVIKQSARGMFDARPTEQEKAEGLTTPYDFWLRPIERAVTGQMQEGEEAANLLQHGDYGRGVAHGIASILPLIGPWAAEATDAYYNKLAHGDVAGAIGELGGNAAVAAAMEAAPKVGRAGVGLAKSVPDRIAEFQAPAEQLNEPVAPGQMSPKERWQAAQKMGVNLDRAQATGGANIPGTAKRVTEESLAGRGVFERNNAANLDALHEHAHAMQEGAGPEMGREQFGEKVQRSLQNHRNNIVDEAGQRAEARDLLNRIDRRDMDAQEFGAQAQQTLREHHDATYQKASDLLTSALERQGSRVRTGNVEDIANQIYSKNKEHFEEFPEALRSSGVKLAWDWVNRLRQREWKGEGAQRLKLASRSLPPAEVAQLRSELWNLYQSPDIVGTQAEGWLKQLTGALDESLTDPANENGMTPNEIQKFRAGNSLWKKMKSMYDDPQSPFFSILRSPEPLTIAGTLEKLKPTAAAQFREAMGDLNRGDLVRQQQRQIVSHVLDPNGNGVADLSGLSSRFEKLPKEQMGELLDKQHLNALGSLAKRTQETTPYDTFPHLRQIVDAPDGMAASRVMFSDNGALRLTPAEVEHLSAADPDLIPILRRQTMERLMDPAGNGTPDLRNFAARWTRAQKAPAGAVLTPEQMQDLDDLAEVGRTVQTASNPSGTARTLQPANEAGNLVKGVAPAVGAVLGGMHGGFEGAGAGAAVGSVADTLARGAVARRLVNPDATAAIMEHDTPPTLKEIWKSASETPGLISGTVHALPQGPDITIPGVKDAADGGLRAPKPPLKVTTSVPASETADKTQEVPLRAPKPPVSRTSASPQANEREGVSTPPNGGQITDTGKAEPNEVHNPAEADAVMQELEGKQSSHSPSAVSSGPTQSGAAPESHGGTQPADIVTGTTAGGNSPQAKIQPPEGATHEVLGENGETLGHVVDGEYVPLQSAMA